MSRIRHFLGFEDHAEPMTEAEAEAVLESENPDAEIDAHHQEQADVHDDVVDEVATMEAFQTILASGIESQKTSPQFAAAVAVMQERCQKNIMPSAFANAPGLESIDQSSYKDMIEYYQVSHEGFKDLIQTLRTSWRNKRSTDVNFFEGGADKARQARGDALLSLVTRCRGDLNKQADPVVVTVDKKEAKHLSTTGRVPSDLAKSAKTDSDLVQGVFNQYLPAYREFTDKVFKEAAQIFQNLDGALQKPKPLNDQLAGVASLTFPPNMIPSDMLSGKGLLNNEYVRFSPPDYRQGDVVSTLEAWCDTSFPRFKPVQARPPMADVSFTITPKEVEAILDIVESNAKALKQSSKDNYKIRKSLEVHSPMRLYEKLDRINFGMLSDMDRLLLDHFGSFLVVNEMFVMTLLSGTYRHIAEVSEALVQVCRRATATQSA